MNELINVYCDGSLLKMALQELKSSGFNVVKHRTNGYSLDWWEAIEFEEKHINVIQGVPTVWCTKVKVGERIGNSVYSNS